MACVRPAFSANNAKTEVRSVAIVTFLGNYLRKSCLLVLFRAYFIRFPHFAYGAPPQAGDASSAGRFSMIRAQSGFAFPVLE